MGNERLAAGSETTVATYGWRRGTRNAIASECGDFFVEASTLRTRRLLVSAMYMFPALSNTTELGPFKSLSRRSSVLVFAVASAARASHGGNCLRPWSRVEFDCWPGRRSRRCRTHPRKLCRDRRGWRWWRQHCRPSPPPAKVVMVPVVSTCRMRWLPVSEMMSCRWSRCRCLPASPIQQRWHAPVAAKTLNTVSDHGANVPVVCTKRICGRLRPRYRKLLEASSLPPVVDASWHPLPPVIAAFCV